MIYFFLTLATLIAAIVLTIINWRVFWLELKKVDKKYFLFLALLLVFLFSVFNSSLNFHPSDREWEELYRAQSLTQWDALNNSGVYGFIYSILLAPLFKVFGPDPALAVLLNLFLAGACVFLIFFLSKIIFQKDLVAFFAAIIFAIHPFSLWYFFIQSGWPILTCFWLLIILIVLILFFKNPQKFGLAFLSLLLIFLAAQTRPEYFVLILLLPICLFLYFKPLKEKYKNLHYSKIVSIGLAFFLVFLLLFPSVFAMKDSQAQADWCGEGQTLNFTLEERKEVWGGNLFSPILEKIDELVNLILNVRFSLYYIPDDLPVFLSFFLASPFWLLLPLIIFGFLIGLKKYFRITILLFLPILLLASVYLLDCNYSEARYIIPLYAPLVVFAAGGLNYLIEMRAWFARRKGVVVVVLFLAAFIGWNFEDLYRIQRLDFPLSCRETTCHLLSSADYKAIREISQSLDSSDSMLISVYQHEEVIWTFLGYKASSLGEKLKVFLDSKEGFYTSLDSLLATNKDNYFLLNKCYFADSCGWTKLLYELVDCFVENYSLEEKESNSTYILYKILD